MAIKKTIKIIFIGIMLILVLPKIIIDLYDYVNQVSFGKYNEIITVLDTDKKVYNLHDTISFSMSYTSMGDKNTNMGINICEQDTNNVSLIIKKSVPIRVKEVFSKKYWINNLSYVNSSQVFNFKCPNNLIKNKGLVLFEKLNKFKFKFKLNFIKENDEYFLVSNNIKMKLDKNPSYYLFDIFLIEGLLSSNDTSLGRYVHINIVDDKLYINHQL